MIHGLRAALGGANDKDAGDEAARNAGNAVRGLAPLGKASMKAASEGGFIAAATLFGRGSGLEEVDLKNFEVCICFVLVETMLDLNKTIHLIYDIAFTRLTMVMAVFSDAAGCNRQNESEGEAT